MSAQTLAHRTFLKYWPGQASNSRNDTRCPLNEIYGVSAEVSQPPLVRLSGNRLYKHLVADLCRYPREAGSNLLELRVDSCPDFCCTVLSRLSPDVYFFARNVTNRRFPAEIFHPTSCNWRPPARDPRHTVPCAKCSDFSLAIYLGFGDPSSARFNSRTLTCGSPRTPNWRAWMCARTRLSTASLERCRAAATRET
jgi:hypothetical protein